MFPPDIACSHLGSSDYERFISLGQSLSPADQSTKRLGWTACQPQACDNLLKFEDRAHECTNLLFSRANISDAAAPLIHADCPLNVPHSCTQRCSQGVQKSRYVLSEEEEGGRLHPPGCHTSSQCTVWLPPVTFSQTKLAARAVCYFRTKYIYIHNICVIVYHNILYHIIPYYTMEIYEV